MRGGAVSPVRTGFGECGLRVHPDSANTFYVTLAEVLPSLGSGLCICGIEGLDWNGLGRPCLLCPPVASYGGSS